MVSAPVRYTLALIGFLLVGYIGWSAYVYIFDTTVPEVTVVGIEDGDWYVGDVPCVIAMRDQAKVADLSLFLDSKPLVSHFKIGKVAAEHTCIIPTTSLPYGKHELRIVVSDSSYRKNTTECRIQFFVDNIPLQAAFIRPDVDIKVFQGRTLHLMFQASKRIKSAVAKCLNREHICVPEDGDSTIYEAFIPIACEERATEYPLSIEITDAVGTMVTLDTKFQVVAFPFPKQTLKLDPEAIAREKASWPNQQEFENKISELTKRSPHKKLWRGSFYMPTEVHRISTAFGTVRATQHRGRYMHQAVDLVGEPKRVVWAPQDGVIVLQERYAASGNTVVIDHGCGILSLFFHLDSCAELPVGSVVHQGNPIGTIGKTGFADGYHVHWELRIDNIAVDPLQWIKDEF